MNGCTWALPEKTSVLSLALLSTYENTLMCLFISSISIMIQKADNHKRKIFAFP
ncbi:hypothetical protein EI42_02758 [Thermosporothrix hazakensis]|uniref:Uncharacterized protein n=1 Tax=Thermosporothrix hazakensis TaxID=644383 RepID=A0A326U7F8_THEHA|nr:hypothetical protein EI42_02758 [Thermosporothrix hazakensis]